MLLWLAAKQLGGVGAAKAVAPYSWGASSAGRCGVACGFMLKLGDEAERCDGETASLLTTRREGEARRAYGGAACCEPLLMDAEQKTGATRCRSVSRLNRLGARCDEYRALG